MSKSAIVLLLGAALALMLAACSAAQPTPLVQPEATSTAEGTPEPTATEWPTPYFPPTVTPTPTATPRAQTSEDAFAFAQRDRLGRGVNLGNALEAPSEGEWGMVIEERFFDLIADAGFSHVRLPVRWDAYAPAQAPYPLDPAIFDRVDEVVGWASTRGLSVIINIHHFDEDIHLHPAAHRERFMAIWQQIAEHYAGAPDTIYFELLNEPNNEFGSSNAWNDLARDTLALVRESNPQRTVLIGPGDWNAVTALPGLQLPEQDRNIIVEYHYYQPFRFTHQGAEWVENSTPWLGTTWDGDSDQQAAVRADFDLAADWGRDHARPLYMGEFGAFSKGDIDSRARWTNFVAREAEARGFTWAYWEFGAGFGVFDREQNAWNQPILEALIPPQ